MSINLIILVIMIVCLAAFVRSAFGFGEGMVNMALLTLVVNLNFSAPFVALVALFSGSYMLIRDWKNVVWKEIGMLLIGALLFIPIGLYAERFLNKHVMKAILGMLIICFAIYKLFTPQLGKLKNANWGFLFGVFGGFFGGAYNVAGPPAALFGNMRGWNPPVFRVSLQGYFLPIACFTVLGRILNNQYTLEVIVIALFAIPAVVLGVVLGKMLNRRIKNQLLFQRIIYGMLIVLGTLLIL